MTKAELKPLPSTTKAKPTGHLNGIRRPESSAMTLSAAMPKTFPMPYAWQRTPPMSTRTISICERCLPGL